MTTWTTTVQRIGHLLESRFDQLRYRLKQQLKYDQPVQVVPYAGYGNAQHVYLKGRVLEYHGEDIEQAAEESLWKNLANTYRRFESDEVPNLQLIAELGAFKQQTSTDEEGYFLFTLPTPKDLHADVLWHHITVSVPTQPMLKTTPAPTVGKVLIPPPACDFGVISDMDDTILVTNATSLLRMARLTFLHSPAMRLPFPGVAAFYRALQNDGSVPRPLFYVSSSPWNLYDFLSEFMLLNQIPAGPLLLQDFGLDVDRLIHASHRAHKLAQITHIMDTYPELPFILIGDSGQHDPEIYAEIVANRAPQIHAIYIRDVSDNQRDEEVRRLAQQARQHGIDMLLVPDTLAAAEHATTQGYIDSASLTAIQTDFTKDTKPADLLEQALSDQP
ncbi:MAG: phosphatase domain-containing protein [Candidatus Competibacteraceae bacterium]|jgi:phosphatidate phosphatase APP1|nr:phosphatase domain-containing protein [Candidatus Competibacteraceae bacterium]